jgi:hypothetical protein
MRSRHRDDFVRVLGLDEAQELAECMSFHDWVTERKIRVHAVDIAAALAPSLDISGVFEVSQHAVGVTLRDRCGRRDLPHAHITPLRDGEQDLGVVRDERPSARWSLR